MAEFLQRCGENEAPCNPASVDLTQQGCRLIVDGLRRAFGSRLKTIVVFGSQARGEAGQGSDVDVFIVVDGLARDPVARQREARGWMIDCVADLPGPLGLVCRTPREFESDLTPLFLDVCVDGICLYGDVYFEPYRRRALSALQASGLRRRRIGNAWHWLFPGAPPRYWQLSWDGYRERS
jgi:hypothetical protein